MAENPNSNMQGFLNGQGLIAEMSLLFFRNLIKAGASQNEAVMLSQAYIGAILYGKKKEGDA